MAKILLVDTDEATSRHFALLLSQEQHTIDVTHADPLLDVTTRTYDLLVLDCCRIGKIDPFIFCQRYRSRGGSSAILAILDTPDPEEEAALLDAGADDCLSRGSHPSEVSARIRALLRRPGDLAPNIVKLRDVEIDCNTSRVIRSGQEIPLTPKEFNILLLLMRYPNKNFTPESILERLWNSSTLSSVDTVRTHVKTLRRKLNDMDESNPLIRTTRGWGYKVVPD